MSSRKKRRSLVPFWLRFTLIGIIAAALILTAAVTVLPMLGISLKLPFISHTRVSESEVLLKEIHPLFKLTTVEYTYKSVFPYDFIPENSDPQGAYTRQQRGEKLTSQQEKAARLYRVCLESGVPLRSRSTEFVVLTSRVKGGYNLDPEKSEKSRLQVHLNPALGTAEIQLPDPVITDFIIQDETSDHYQYPDIHVDAEQWRIITDYVQDKIRSRVLDEGILITTDKKMKELLTRIMQASGWEHIVFTTASDSH